MGLTRRSNSARRRTRRRAHPVEAKAGKGEQRVTRWCRYLQIVPGGLPAAAEDPVGDPRELVVHRCPPARARRPVSLLPPRLPCPGVNGAGARAEEGGREGRRSRVEGKEGRNGVVDWWARRGGGGGLVGEPGRDSLAAWTRVSCTFGGLVGWWLS